MAKKKANKAAKAEPIKLERVVERVKHNYTDDELIVFAYELGQKYRAIRAVQSEAKAVKKDYAARESSIESDIDEISERVNTRFEMRAKECFKFFDYKGGNVYWFLCADIESAIAPDKFPDVDELLNYLLADEDFSPAKSRPITQNERQQKLDEGVNNDDKQTVETS